MVTENLQQNILDADTSGKRPEKRKRKKTIVRTAEQSAAERKRKETIVRTAE
jgi:hypothetical protein